MCSERQEVCVWGWDGTAEGSSGAMRSDSRSRLHGDMVPTICSCLSLQSIFALPREADLGRHNYCTRQLIISNSLLSKAERDRNAGQAPIPPLLGNLSALGSSIFPCLLYEARYFLKGGDPRTPQTSDQQAIAECGWWDYSTAEGPSRNTDQLL